MSRPVATELAVVIVNYNTGAWLTRCLASLERHRGDVTIDVLVIDNASDDGSHTAAHADHPWVRMIANDRNVYLSPAWNEGARETSAPYLLFLNPDTEWWSGTLADYLQVAREHPSAGIVGPMIRNTDGSPYPSGRSFPSVVDAVGHAFLSPFSRANPFTRRYELDGWDRATERTVDWVSGSCMLIPRAAFDAVGGFDEAFPLYAEELDLATRLRDAGWSVLFTPRVEVLHEIGVSTAGSRRAIITHSRSVYRYYRKHRAPGWRRISLPLAWLALRVRAEIAWLRGRYARR
jgi:N-acetylglucosaminyl-diphospho-decaprenol L-rhamnosyltransferase